MQQIFHEMSDPNGMSHFFDAYLCVMRSIYHDTAFYRTHKINFSTHTEIVVSSRRCISRHKMER